MNVYRAVGLALLLYSSSLTNPVLAKPFMIVGTRREDPLGR